MTRLVALFALTATSLPAVASQLPVAPPPREVRPDGSRDPAPDAAKAEDPAEVVNRIIANAKRASDKLATADAGEGTRSTQAGILKDIDTLLDPPDSPPKGGGGDSNDKDKQDKSDGKGNDQKEQNDDGKSGGGMSNKQDGMGNKGGGDPKGGMNPGGMGQPMGGQASGRRPRSGGQPKDGNEPSGTATAGKAGGQPPAPMAPGGATAKASTPKDPPGATTAGIDPKGARPPPLQPQVPLADEVAKEVWGHLPERMRQKLSQYYREDFMPRYAGLLKQYYSSLANTPNGAGPAPRPVMPR